MPMRLGPGPVFVYEWLTAARRWQLYAMRAGFIGTILIGLCLVWNQISGNRLPDAPVSIQELAQFGWSIYRTITLVELTLILLAAPAATAGAVCFDKARGTLDHMLATDLSNAEIVLGKLGVRLIPVLGADRLRAARGGADVTSGRDRPAGASRLVPRGGRLRLRGLLAGDGAVGPRAEGP